eukprot:9820229-Alexandrium_andersonii.AAC.1
MRFASTTNAFIARRPRATTPLHVERRVATNPAKSVSAHTRRRPSPWETARCPRAETASTEPASGAPPNPL